MQASRVSQQEFHRLQTVSLTLLFFGLGLGLNFALQLASKNSRECHLRPLSAGSKKPPLLLWPPTPTPYPFTRAMPCVWVWWVCVLTLCFLVTESSK